LTTMIGDQVMNRSQVILCQAVDRGERP